MDELDVLLNELQTIAEQNKPNDSNNNDVDKKNLKQLAENDSAGKTQEPVNTDNNANAAPQTDVTDNNVTVAKPMENINIVDNALNTLQYQSMIQDEINNFFTHNPAFSSPQIKQTVLSTAFGIVKAGANGGKPITIKDALHQASELIREQMINLMKDGRPLLREAIINRNKNNIVDFWKKAQNYTDEDYYRDYVRNIMPSMTVKGLNVVRLEKGFGKEYEEVLPGSGDDYKRKYLSERR